MFRTMDAARFLSSLVRQKPSSVLRIDRRLRKNGTTADFHADRDFSSAYVLSNSKTASRNTTTGSDSDNRTDVRESSDMLTDVPVNDRTRSLGMPTDDSAATDASTKKDPPAIPVTCCMSGCPNCVWIQFAAEVTDHISDGSKQAKELVQEIEDPSMKAFVLLELEKKQKSS